MRPASDLTAIPAGRTLVHIGFPKTGTTSLQRTLSDHRELLATMGVCYPGRDTQHKRAAIALLGTRGRIGDPPADIRDWEALTREVRKAAQDRVMVSSEWLCEANDEQARRVVEELGGDRVHIVATIRPLADVLPSSWQQYVQNGFRRDYVTWLRGMLLKPPYEKPTPSFWRRHRHDVVLSRWASVVGPDRMTLVVVDTRDRQQLFRVFESMLGLEAQTLQPPTAKQQNRSLSYPEVELLRSLNKEIRRHDRWEALHRELVTQNLLPALAEAHVTHADLPSIATPQWALDRAAEIGAEMVANIRAIGLRVVGDLEKLTTQAVAPPDDSGPIDRVPLDVAVAAMMSSVAAGRGLRRRERLMTVPLPRAVRRLARRVGTRRS